MRLVWRALVARCRLALNLILRLLLHARGPRRLFAHGARRLWLGLAIFAMILFFVFVFSDKQMLNMAADLFLAGQETTSNMITWSFGFLIYNPDVQSRVHEELDAIIGSDRTITMVDRNNLPYTSATINEIYR